MFKQPSKLFPDMVDMILKCLAEYNDVINASYTYFIPQTIEAVFHKSFGAFFKPIGRRTHSYSPQGLYELSYVYLKNLKNLNSK